MRTQRVLGGFVSVLVGYMAAFVGVTPLLQVFSVSSMSVQPVSIPGTFGFGFFVTDLLPLQLFTMLVISSILSFVFDFWGYKSSPRKIRI